MQSSGVKHLASVRISGSRMPELALLRCYAIMLRRSALSLNQFASFVQPSSCQQRLDQFGLGLSQHFIALSVH